MITIIHFFRDLLFSDLEAVYMSPVARNSTKREVLK